MRMETALVWGTRVFPLPPSGGRAPRKLILEGEIT